MKYIKTLLGKNLKETIAKGGCVECQILYQSTARTPSTVGNQKCEDK